MIFKSILIVISIIQFSLCNPIYNNVWAHELRIDEEHSEYVTVDCKGNSMDGQNLYNLVTILHNTPAVSAITLENCDIALEKIMRVFPNFATNATQIVFRKNNTLPTADFTFTRGLSLLVIDDQTFKTPSSLQVEASEMKWFEYNGNDDKVIDNITMKNSTKLELFSMENTSVSSFPDDFFKNSTNLKIVRVPSNKLESIDSVRWPNSVKWLDVSKNKITHLSNKSFENVEHLQGLLVNNNSINEIEAGSFSKLNNLIYLMMEKNHIEEVKTGMFAGLSDLVGLDLSYNKIENIEVGAFEDTPKMGALNLVGNEITHLDQNTFKGMHSLTYVKLAWNSIDEMALETFANMSHLRNLDLSHCKLKSVDFNAFANTLYLSELDLSHNKIEHLVKMSSHQPTKNNVSNNSSQSEAGMMDTFNWMDPIEEIGGDFMGKSTKKFFNEVLGLNFLLDLTSFVVDIEVAAESWKLSTLNLTENHLTVIEKDVFVAFKNLEDLYLTNNPIATLYPESFAGLNALETLHLSGCKLASVDFSIFAHLTKLEKLDLSFNQLATIAAAPLPSVEKLYINDNQLTSFPIQKNNFPKLTQLNIQNNQLECVPQWMLLIPFNSTEQQ